MAEQRLRAPATASCPAWLLISKHCKAWPGLAISRPVPGDYPALPVLRKSSISERQSPGAQPGPGAAGAAEPAALSTGDRGRSTHTHVHGPENGEELIPEANLFCSNPAAVTGSPPGSRLRSCGGSHRFHAFSQCQLVTFPRRRRRGGDGWEGEASLPALVYLTTEHEGVYSGNEQKPGGSRLQSRGMRPPQLTGCPFLTRSPPSSFPARLPAP